MIWQFPKKAYTPLPLTLGFCLQTFTHKKNIKTHTYAKLLILIGTLYNDTCVSSVAKVESPRNLTQCESVRCLDSTHRLVWIDFEISLNWVDHAFLFFSSKIYWFQLTKIQNFCLVKIFFHVIILFEIRDTEFALQKNIY